MAFGSEQREKVVNLNTNVAEALGIQKKGFLKKAAEDPLGALLHLIDGQSTGTSEFGENIYLPNVPKTTSQKKP